MKLGGCVYIITDQYNTVIDTGETSALKARIWQHKNHFFPKNFTAKYNCKKIIWYEVLLELNNPLKGKNKLKAQAKRIKRL